MKNLYITLTFLIVLLITACEKNWLEREPKDLVLESQVWNDKNMISGLLSNYYNRLTTDAPWIDYASMASMSDYDDAMWSGHDNQNAHNNIVQYPISKWQLWNYGLIRDINLALENMEIYGTKLTTEQKKQFNAEFRFIRAWNYFDLVKRMGGVPLVTTQLIYDFSGDPSPLRMPRAKEYEVYDFIANECDAIMDFLGNTGSVSRANKYTALALKSRAMLYAASTAKYNNLMGTPITLPGEEVGISASMANAYYLKSLEASRAIITSGAYSLYMANPNKGENFYEAVTKKSSNKEIIFVQDYLKSSGKTNFFTTWNIARNIREGSGGSAIGPSLNLVETYDYLDGTSGVLKNRTADNSDYIYYTNIIDIFANKDARLYGTIIYPGTSFKGLPVEIQAGVKEWNAATKSYKTVEGSPGTYYTDNMLLTGGSGPHRSLLECSNTGFYLRKYIDAGAVPTDKSDMWWVWSRLGEIYLNATEAAFELGYLPEALGYINTLRQRAGFTANSLNASTLTIGKIQNERRCELAFEDHREWDLKRWRIAHLLWDGVATNPNAKVYALYPYRVIRPEDPTKNGKYVFDKFPAPRLLAARYFVMGNYYSQISQTVLNNNPLIVKNPFH